MRTILIDTNFWLLPFEKGLNVLEQLDRLSEDEPWQAGISSSVKDELEAMARGPANGRRVRPAKAALRAIEQLLASGRARLLPYNGPADGSLITLALQTNAWVATNDRALKARLKEKKIKVVVLRDEHKLEFG
ncbi:Uncharacterised protein [uncultured archaeon]|nr:Uncharacterised protein [uncultured archaeon]